MVPIVITTVILDLNLGLMFRSTSQESKVRILAQMIISGLGKDLEIQKKLENF